MSIFTLDLPVCLRIKKTRVKIFFPQSYSYFYCLLAFSTALEPSKAILFSDPLYMVYFILLETVECSMQPIVLNFHL